MMLAYAYASHADFQIETVKEQTAGTGWHSHVIRRIVADAPSHLMNPPETGCPGMPISARSTTGTNAGDTARPGYHQLGIEVVWQTALDEFRNTVKGVSCETRSPPQQQTTAPCSFTGYSQTIGA
jgi:hypothetical protein